MGAAVGGSNFGANVSDTESQTDAASGAFAQAQGILNTAGPAKSATDVKTHQDTDQDLYQKAGNASNTDETAFKVGG